MHNLVPEESYNTPISLLVMMLAIWFEESIDLNICSVLLKCNIPNDEDSCSIITVENRNEIMI